MTGLFGPGASARRLGAMGSATRHRGPDHDGGYQDPQGRAALGHNRLSIIDLSEGGDQPMSSPDGRYVLVFNGEIYNYRELRKELSGYPFRSESDSEVLLAAWSSWGSACLDRLLGMFAFIVWDVVAGEATLVRDRFGVKPLYSALLDDGTLAVSSEIKGLHAAGLKPTADLATWSTFLADGRLELPGRTFWEGATALPPGALGTWKDGALTVRRWYDLEARVGVAVDDRAEEVVAEEWLQLALESIELRFRADVPVGVNLSGGVDSSFLLAAIHASRRDEHEVTAYTFTTGDPNYDELPWVEELLAETRHPSVVVELTPGEVPELAASVAAVQDEPFGGLPTLAYAKLFAEARSRGTIVLLDGQGLDEQWAGYDYYRSTGTEVSVVQGTTSPPTRAAALLPAAAEMVLPRSGPPAPSDPDLRLRSLQVRDLVETKIPRALRYNDRVSMRSSCELREPFLDHRLVELALRQPASRKVDGATGKVLLRRILADRLPGRVVQAPKRPMQTPQREWLRGPLAPWADDRIEAGLQGTGRELLDPGTVRGEWQRFRSGQGDNSFFIWQWISLGLMLERAAG